MSFGTLLRDPMFSAAVTEPRAEFFDSSRESDQISVFLLRSGCTYFRYFRIEPNVGLFYVSCVQFWCVFGLVVLSKLADGSAEGFFMYDTGPGHDATTTTLHCCYTLPLFL